MLEEFDDDEGQLLATAADVEDGADQARQQQLVSPILVLDNASPHTLSHVDSVDVADVDAEDAEFLLGRSPAALGNMPPPGLLVPAPAHDVVEVADTVATLEISQVMAQSVSDADEAVHATGDGARLGDDLAESASSAGDADDLDNEGDKEDEDEADADFVIEAGEPQAASDLGIADGDGNAAAPESGADAPTGKPLSHRRGHKRVSSNTSFVSVNLSHQATATIIEPADAAAVQRFRLDVLNLADYHPDMASRVRVTCNGLPLGISVEASGKDSLVPGMVVVHIAPNGAVSKQGLINVGDLLLKVNGQSLVCLPEKRVATILKAAARKPEVELEVIVQDTAFDVDMTRVSPDEELGFTISDAVVDSIRPQSLADRAHLQLGHKIISVNRESTAGWTDEQILAALGTTFEVKVQTMPLHVWEALYLRAARASSGLKAAAAT